jgi:hypothetical protein
MLAICGQRRRHRDIQVGDWWGWQNLGSSRSLRWGGVYLQVDDGVAVGMNRMIKCACIACLLGERAPRFVVKHVLHHVIITSYLVFFFGQNFLSDFPTADLL